MASMGSDDEYEEVEEYKEKVQVYLYDLSGGMAAALSQSFLGKQIDGIWHTGIVVYGYEYYYGGGIQVARPGGTMAGKPMRVIDIGETEIPQEVFHDFLHEVSHQFTPETYSLLKHNCNNFTSAASKFLTGLDIPSYITGLPEEALNTPMGQMLRPMIENMEQNMKAQGGHNGMVPWQEQGKGPVLYLPKPKAPVYKKVRRKKNAKQPAVAASSSSSSSSSALPPNRSADDEKKEIDALGVDHGHCSLALHHISARSASLTSSDSKYKSFLALIKVGNKKAPQNAKLSKDDIVLLTKVVGHMSSGKTDPIDTSVYPLFSRMLSWPRAQLFGVVGLFRLLVRRAEARAYYRGQAPTDNSGKLPADIERVISLLQQPDDNNTANGNGTANGSGFPVVQLMALCTVCNLFVDREYFAPRLAQLPAVVDAAVTALNLPLSKQNKPSRLIAAAVLYNMSLVLPKDDSDLVMRCVSILVEALQAEQDAETCVRALLALGHLVYCNDEAGLVAVSLEFNTANMRQRFPGGGNATHSKIHQVLDDIDKLTANLM